MLYAQLANIHQTLPIDNYVFLISSSWLVLHLFVFIDAWTTLILWVESDTMSLTMSIPLSSLQLQSITTLTNLFSFDYVNKQSTLILYFSRTLWLPVDLLLQSIPSVWLDLDHPSIMYPLVGPQQIFTPTIYPSTFDRFDHPSTFDRVKLLWLLLQRR